MDGQPLLKDTNEHRDEASPKIFIDNSHKSRRVDHTYSERSEGRILII